MTQVTLDHILQAAERIQVHRTPVMSSQTINEYASKESPVELFFKCELLQKTGSFKFRGASNAIQLLTPEEAKNGVVCHSSGNHAQAVALAAKQRGIPAYIVMPKTAAAIKKEAVIGYGAKIIECESSQADREKVAKEVLKQTGAAMVHPFNDPNVIAGQGTIVLELLSQVNDLDAIIIPVGGGGMLTGCSIAAKSLNPRIKIYAVEPEATDDTRRSFKSKQRFSNELGRTSVADGLAADLGEIAFESMQKYVDDVFTASEREIIQATEIIWKRLKQCIEPSAGVGVGVALFNKEFQERIKKEKIQRIGVILCGGNVDIINMAKLFSEL